MTPMIVIGCGGSGGKVIASLRRSLELQLRNKGWDEGIPEAWQLIYVDTPASQEVNVDFGDPVPVQDYISISEGQDVYRHVDHAVMNMAGPERLDRFLGWRPSPSLSIPVARGAGQWRAVGRMAAFNGLPSVARRIQRAVSATVSGRSQLERLGGLVGDPAPIAGDAFVLVVSSLAGGTGAGVFLDVCDVVRAVEPNLQSRIAGVLFTAEVFRDLPNVPGVQPNTLAAMAELMAGYFDADRHLEPLYQGVVGNRSEVVGRAGVNYPFVVGMSTLSGKQLEEIPHAYRAVTETLAAAMLNPRVSESLLAHQVTNWTNEQSMNTVAWDFGNARRPDGAAVDSAVVSSFGSARLSVGVARFGEYAVHRLARAVVEHLREGYLSYGRELLNDEQATPDQVVDHLVRTNGLRFVEDCGMRELNDADVDGPEHNQVLDAVFAQSELDAVWKQWWQTVHRELGAFTGNQALWHQTITQTIPLRTPGFRDQVSSRCRDGVEGLRASLVDRVLEQVSTAVAQFGVPVAKALVIYLADHVRAAAKQLRDEAISEREKGARWRDGVGEALRGLGDTKVGADHQLVEEAVRRGGAVAYREAKAQAREGTATFLDEFGNQVLTRLMDMLDQVQGRLANPDARERVASWPVEDGIPAVFSPPPHEYCLVPATEWPQRYTRLLEATTRREPGAPGTSEEVARRWVGGGGFRVDRTDSKPVAPALTVREPWQGGTVRFDSRFDVDDVLERARLWLTRKGSPFGDFLDQRLRAYLSPVQNGRPVADLQQRINRFKDGLQSTLQSATPLVYIDSAVFGRVHPRSGWRNREMTTLVAEALPLPPGSEAREAAEEVLRATVPPHRPVEEFFGDGTVDVEGVLYVSRLAGAVHPATVTSLTAPIAQRWAAVRSSGAIGGFWQNRRARPLAEFCPVSPAVLDQMIRGWFTGRLLGIIPDPTAQRGFQIGYERYGEIKRARFPWPLLRGGPELIDRSLRREWLPGLLETLVISFVLVAAETDSVDAYDELWKLGGSSALRGWIVEGKSVAALTTPQVNGSTAQERKDHVLDALVQMREPYHHELTSTAVVDDPAQFFRIPYGFELYPRLLSALDSLEAGISAVSTGGEEFG